MENLAAGVSLTSLGDKSPPDISKPIKKSSNFSNVAKDLQVFYLCRKCLDIFPRFKRPLQLDNYNKVPSNHQKSLSSELVISIQVNHFMNLRTIIDKVIVC